MRHDQILCIRQISENVSASVGFGIHHIPIGECRPLTKQVRSESVVQIQSPFLIKVTSKFNGTPLSKDIAPVKSSVTSEPFFQKYELNCGKMPRLAILKNSLKIPGSIHIQKQMTFRM